MAFTRSSTAGLHLPGRFLITFVVLASGALSSAKAASYTNTVRAGFNLIANPLDTTNNRLNSVLSGVSDGARLYTWNEGTQSYKDPDIYVAGMGWVDGASNASRTTLSPGEGAALYTAGACTIVVSGSGRTPVLPLPIVRNRLCLVSRQEPGPGTYENIVGLPPENGSIFIRLDRITQGYVVSSYDGNVWSGGTPTADTGESVFIVAPLREVSFTGSYTQDFDRMGNLSLPIGWYAGSADCVTSTVAGAVSDGATAEPGVYNYGRTGGADRAVGAIAQPPLGSQAYEVRLRNDTEATITTLSLLYDGEQWRVNGNTNAHSLVVRFSADGTNYADLPPAFTFTSPVTTGDTNLNGDLPANRVADLGGTFAASVAPGAVFIIRWFDLADAGRSHGLAIDNVRVEAVSAPVITVQPASQTALVGSAGTTFSVTAGGSAPLTYQWRRGTTNLGAGDTLTLSNLQLADAGDYLVVVSNAHGAVTSQVARLTVHLQCEIPIVAGLNLIANPLDHGSNRLNEIIANAPNGTRIYKYNNGSGTWTVAQFNAREGHEGSAEASEWNLGGELRPFGWTGEEILAPGEGAFLESPTNFTLRFTGIPHVPVLPISVPANRCYLLSCQANTPGTWETITGTAPGPGAQVFLWGEGGYAMFSFDDIDLAWQPADPVVDVGRAMWISPTGGMPPQIATPPQVMQQPQNLAVTEGQDATFAVVATGTAPLTYQWKRGVAHLTNGVTCTIHNARLSDAGLYAVVVSNPNGSIQSETAVLTVVPARAPGLNVALVDRQLRISWPAGGAQTVYTIQQSTNLNESYWPPLAPWDNWPIRDTSFSLELNAGPARFFRLVATERGRVISVRTAATIPAAVINSVVIPELMAETPPWPAYPVQHDLKVLVVEYETLDPLLGPTKASGVICVPKGMTQARPDLLSYQHGTVVLREHAPSGGGLARDRNYALAIAASLGYVVALPDYLGLGPSSTGLHPYAHRRSSATATVDLLRAVRTLIATDPGLKMDVPLGLSDKLFLMGYSQGGYVTLATQREIEEKHSTEFVITASAPSEGPYDLSGVMLPHFGDCNAHGNASQLPYLLLSYNPIYHYFQQATEIMVSPYAFSIPPLFDGAHDLNAMNCALNPYCAISDPPPGDACVPPPALKIQITPKHTIVLPSMYPPQSPSHILQPAFVQDYFTNPNSVIRAIVKENDLTTGWTPSSPTRLYHCVADQAVPVENAINAFGHFNSSAPGCAPHCAPNVDLILNPDVGLNHDSGYPYSILDTLIWFQSLR